MEEILEMAERLGQSLARTQEYQSLRRAVQSSGEDRELTELQNQVLELEREMELRLRAGNEPTKEQAEKYDGLFGRLQSNASYQRLVSAQANFDKLVARVNDTIHRGIEKGAESRIILT